MHPVWRSPRLLFRYSHEPLPIELGYFLSALVYHLGGGGVQHGPVIHSSALGQGPVLIAELSWALPLPLRSACCLSPLPGFVSVAIDYGLGGGFYGVLLFPPPPTARHNLAYVWQKK